MPTPVSLTASSTFAPGRALAARGDVVFVELDVLGLDRQPPAVGHRVARVGREVEDHALDLRLVGLDRREAGRDPHADADVVADDPPHHRLHPGHDLVEVEHARVQHLAPAEGEQLAREAGRLLGRVGDLAELLAARRVGLGEQDLRVARDHGQQVVEVVRDAAGEPPDRLHLLRLAEPLLEPQPLGHVVGEHERGRPALEHHLAGRDLDVDQRAVLLAVAPRPRHRRARAAARLEVAEQLVDVLARPDVGDRHGQELLARVAVVAHGRLVDRQEAQGLGVVDPHRQRVGLEQEPVALLRVGQRLEQAGGLDRRRGAPRQLGGEVEVGAAEGAAVLGRQRDRAPGTLARHQRHAQVRGGAGHELAAGAQQLRLAGPHHHGRAVRPVGPQRRAVVRRGGGAHDRAVLAQHVDRAPVGEAGDEQGGEALERLLAGPR